MSGFDEEAERERLREKYERDREKRTATQRMSELLLKGGTMTNRHCDECGDPIFRHDGEEFCPTCRAEGAPGATATEDGADPDRPDAGADAGPPEPAAERAEPASDERAEPASDEPSVAAAADDGAESRRTVAEPRGGPADRVRDAADRSAAGSAPREDLADARESLSRTLSRFARAAEETDDPRRATELLAAAREAAEALSALDRR